MRPKTVRRLSLVFSILVAGCGGAETSNLSPTSDQDPARHERASRDVQEKARKDQAAEREAFRRKGIPSPPQ